MKKMLLYIVILIFCEIAISYADCPPGYTEHIISSTYVYNYGEYTFTCDYVVAYCCTWDNNLKRVVVQIEWFWGQYNWCVFTIPNWNHFLNWLHETVGDSADNLCVPAYPPCDDTTQNYYERTVSSDRCWKYENWQPYQGDDYVLRMKSCNSYARCESLWRICLDYSTNPASLKQTLISKVANGIPGCVTQEPTLPPEGDPQWNQHWETYCFATPCD